MRHARQRSLALLICLVFSTLELLSAAPALHRHGEGADVFLRPAGAPVVSAAAGASSGPALELPAGEHDHEAPRECPACAISGLSAIVSYGAPVVAPATHPHRIAPLDVQAAASPVIASLRGRAPPLA